MNFNTFLPPEILRPYVKYFYTLEDNDTPASQKTLRAIADGCPGILFQNNADGHLYQGDKTLPGTFLFGQSTCHTNLSLNGTFNAFGVYLQPNALNSIFGLNAELLTDACVDLGYLKKGKEFKLSEKLEDAVSARHKMDLLSSYLIKELNENKAGNNKRLQYALGKITASAGMIPITLLQQEIGMSKRCFERNFKQYVGISPYLFSRICRFQASLKQLNKNDFNKLSDIAYDNNYTDQSHFIRSFKEFAGLSPNQYLKQSNEVIENLSELVL